MPLNSRKLTTAMLNELAAELGVSISASAEDLRLLISGKLHDVEGEPMNVHVVLEKSDARTTVSRRDIDGVFLEAKPLDSGEESEGRVDGSGDEADGAECAVVSVLLLHSLA